MATAYEFTYNPAFKGEGFDAKGLVGAVETSQKLNALDPSSAKGLEAIVKDFGSPALKGFSEDVRSSLVDGYKARVSGDIQAYALKNLKDGVKFVGGDDRVGHLALFMPCGEERKSKDGVPLSEGDQKYNAIIKTEKAINEMQEAMKTAEGRKKQIDSEFGKTNERDKKLWLERVGEQDILNYRLQRAQEAKLTAVKSYGTIAYIKDAMKVSEDAATEFSKKQKEIATNYQTKVRDLTRNPLIIDHMALAKAKDELQEEMQKIDKKYENRAAKGLFFGGIETPQGLLPGFYQLVIEQQKKIEAEEKKKADEAKKAAEAAGKK